MGLTVPRERTIYCLLVFGLILLAWFFLENPIFLWGMLALALGHWCYVLVWLRRYAADAENHDPVVAWELSGLVVLVIPWVALMVLHGAASLGPTYVLFLLGLVWVADSGAFFVGRRWGRRKLARPISPGKTLEGACGGLAAGLLFSLGGAAAFNLDPAQWPGFILICLVTVVFSIVGDLFESMIKRQHDVKDSGALLPGHGGILDRIDSLTAAAPIFLLGLRWLFA